MRIHKDESDKFIATMVKQARHYPISFRAFNKHSNQMYYSYPGCNPQIAFISTSDGWAMYPADKPIRVDYCLASNLDSILMRGSDLSDINGLEIFESDIIMNLTSECSLGQGLQFLKATVYLKNGIFYEDYLHQPIYTYHSMEILGNLYE